MTAWTVPLFALAAVIWAAVLIATPWLPGAAAALVYLFGSLICHQNTERSFHLADAQLPVCARCLGIYVGAAGSLIVSCPHMLLAPLTRQPGRRLRLLLLLTSLPTIGMVAAEWAGVLSTSNLARLTSGALLGGGAAVIVAGAVATLHYGRCVPPQQSRPPCPT